MFVENKQKGSRVNGGGGAGPLPHPIPPTHKSYPSQRLVEPSYLSRWTPNPASLPPRMVSNLQPLSGVRGSAQAPTVPPRSHNADSDNWVDLEELYKWLQELEETREEPSTSDDDVKCGDITQKGYEKKKTRILAPYAPKQVLAPKISEGAASPSTRAKRRAHRNVTRNESRYHSEVRQEAVQQALAAMSSRPKPSLPMPSRRNCPGGYQPGDSSTDDDSVGNEEGDHEDQDSGTPPERSAGRVTNETPQPLVISDSSSGSQTQMSGPPKLPERNRVSNGSGPTLTYSNLGNLAGGNLGWEEKPVSAPIVAPEHRSNRDEQQRKAPSETHQAYNQQQQIIQRNSRPELTDLVEAMNNLRAHQSQTQVSQMPPDVTSTGNSRRLAPADRVNRQNRSQSSSDQSSGTLTGTGRWKVSAKIQQLLNTLKRPKRRPLPEFYEDDDIELEIAAKHKDPNAPAPEGSQMSPAVGEQLTIPSGLPRNLEAAVQRYGSATFKAPVATVLDPNGKLMITLTYGKLLSRSHKIAFALVNKTGHRGESIVKTGERVALVYPNNDPINFMCAFYGW